MASTSCESRSFRGHGDVERVKRRSPVIGCPTSVFLWSSLSQSSKVNLNRTPARRNWRCSGSDCSALLISEQDLDVAEIQVVGQRSQRRQQGIGVLFLSMCGIALVEVSQSPSSTEHVLGGAHVAHFVTDVLRLLLISLACKKHCWRVLRCCECSPLAF